MNVLRALKLFSLLKGLVKSDYQSVADLMGEMHGLPQKLGQHFTLYPGGRYHAYFDNLCTGGKGETIPVEQILREMGVDFNKAEIYAQASIGQVYKVETDSRPLAVKVRYPVVDKRIKADFALLKFLLLPVRLTPLRNNALLPLLENLRLMLLRECDYRKEAEVQSSFHKLFCSDPSVYVPQLVASGEQAIVSEWIEGRNLAHGSVPDGFWFIDTYLRFILKSLKHLNMIHADPHPGNFVITEPLKLVALDFGSVVNFSCEEVSAVTRLLLGEYADEAELVNDIAALGVEADILDIYGPVMGDLISILLEPFYYPGEYDFSNWRLQYKMNTVLASKTWDRPLTIPLNILLFLRTLQGLYFYARTNFVSYNWHDAVKKYMR